MGSVWTVGVLEMRRGPGAARAQGHRWPSLPRWGGSIETGPAYQGDG